MRRSACAGKSGARSAPGRRSADSGVCISTLVETATVRLTPSERHVLRSCAAEIESWGFAFDVVDGGAAAATMQGGVGEGVYFHGPISFCASICLTCSCQPACLSQVRCGCSLYRVFKTCHSQLKSSSISLERLKPVAVFLFPIVPRQCSAFSTPKYVSHFVACTRRLAYRCVFDVQCCPFSGPH
jgi:hypothetical protein